MVNSLEPVQKEIKVGVSTHHAYPNILCIAPELPPTPRPYFMLSQHFLTVQPLFAFHPRKCCIINSFINYNLKLLLLLLLLLSGYTPGYVSVALLKKLQ